MSFEVVSNHPSHAPRETFAGLDGAEALKLIYEYCRPDIRTFCDLYINGYSIEHIALQIKANKEYISRALIEAEKVITQVTTQHYEHTLQSQQAKPEKFQKVEKEAGAQAVRDTVVIGERLPGHWENSAACRFEDVNRELFFSHAAGDIERAKTICRSCPVRKECRDHALKIEEKDGIWGGETSDERRKSQTKSVHRA